MRFVHRAMFRRPVAPRREEPAILVLTRHFTRKETWDLARKVRHRSQKVFSVANLFIDAEELGQLVRQIVEAVLSETDQLKQLMNGKLGLTEAEAAALLGLNPWQLRDLRLAGKISRSRIVGNRIRYTPEDLISYLRRTRETGTNTKR